MKAPLRQDSARLFLATPAYVSLLLLTVTSASSCSFDASKLRTSSSRARDGAIDHSADADTAQDATGGALDVGRVDYGAPDQAPPTAAVDAAEVDAADAAEVDAAVDQESQDSDGATPDMAPDIAIDLSADAEAAQVDTGGPLDVGQFDNGGVDQAPPTDGTDAVVGQDGQDSSGANPETSTGTGIVADGTYRVTARLSGKALEVYFAFTADGSNVDQWTYNGGNNQLWAFTHLGGNVYKILGVQSGRALEVATPSTADGTNVDIRTYTGAATQKWTLSSLAGGYFRLSPMSSIGSALDVANISTADGANIYQWTWLGGNNYNQQWTLQAP